MAGKTARGSVKNNDDRQPLLLVPKEEAERQIQEQIEKGVALRDSIITNASELKEAQEDYYSWHEFNITMLSSMLDNSSVADRYRGITFGGSDPRDLQWNITYFKESDVGPKLRKLSSIKEPTAAVPA